MKKFVLPILLFLMFIPIYVNAETCNTDKITIENIIVENKTNNVEELSEATASGKSINLDLSMSEVGDNIEYKFVVKNDSNEDYELDNTSLNLNSDYINYSFETADNSNIVKANSSKNVMLRVEYKNEVPEDMFENGIYNANKTMTASLSNRTTINVPDTLKNPNTGVQSYILIFVIILLVSGTLFALLRKKKYAEFMILVFGISILIPISVYALCKCEIKIESNVKIVGDSTLTYVYTVNKYDYNATRNNSIWLNEQYPETIPYFETTAEALSAIASASGLDLPFYLKHRVENGIVTESYVEFVITKEMAISNIGMVAGTYTLRGEKTFDYNTNTYLVDEDYISPYYETNKEAMKAAFGYTTNQSRCKEQLTGGNSHFECMVPDLLVQVRASGFIGVYDEGSSDCEVSNGGDSSCDW